MPYTKVTGRSVVRVAIGEELKRRFAVLQPVAQEMLALLVQMNALQGDNDLSRQQLTLSTYETRCFSEVLPAFRDA